MSKSLKQIQKEVSTARPQQVDDLTPDQRNAIAECFIEKSDLQYIAAKTGLAPKTVQNVMANPQFLQLALEAKQRAVGLRAIGKMFDLCMDALDADELEWKEKRQTIKLLQDLLAWNRGRTEPDEDGSKKKTPQVFNNVIEVALRDLKENGELIDVTPNG